MTVKYAINRRGRYPCGKAKRGYEHERGEVNLPDDTKSEDLTRLMLAHVAENHPGWNLTGYKMPEGMR